jgi:hypothetical protein
MLNPDCFSTTFMCIGPICGVRQVHYPGDLKALIGFTGIAELKDGTPVGDWLMDTLRGETEVFDASMAHLHSRSRGILRSTANT